MTIRSVSGYSQGYTGSRFSIRSANPNAFEGNIYPIATTTVGGTDASTIIFSSISSAYSHLQVRLLARSSLAQAGINLSISFNNDFSGSSYAMHQMGASGVGSVDSYGSWDGTYLDSNFQIVPASSALSSVYSGIIIDILDYSDTTKNKTVRVFGGQDRNTGGGVVVVYSGVYKSTSAISSVRLALGAGSFTQYTTAALYGVKA